MEHLEVAGKTVLVRLDLNVPMQAGRITDATRITRSVPTLQYLIERKAKVVILSHLGRPQGFDPGLSLAPLVDALCHALGNHPVKFSPDCIGPTAQGAVEALQPGDVLLMENLRFHAEEKAGEPAFAKAMADLGELYVNDAFSCSHRAHASITGIPQHLPASAGRLMQQEMAALGKVLEQPAHPLTAVVGGSKVSTKLELLGNLVDKVDHLIIGGAMANTFLAAQGTKVGASLFEQEMTGTAKTILKKAEKADCAILLPVDVVVAKQFAPHASARVCAIADIAQDEMILDLGPRSLRAMEEVIAASKTLVWNGPIGAFETAPFDATTVQLARIIAQRTSEGALHSVAGGGDTLAALTHAGLSAQLSYLSTAGGAFLEWLEGKQLPGIGALIKAGQHDAQARVRA